MPLANAKTLKKRNLSDEVYQELRHQVIMGHLKAGERLDIFDIAEQLGVSRTPVKDAFNRLALEGLITIHPNRGTFVSPLSAEKITWVYDVRLMMELWAVRSNAFGRDAAELDAMSAILHRAERLLDAPGEFDWERFVGFDRELHFFIVHSPRNPLLSRLYESVFPQIQLLRVYWGRTRERARLSHEQHVAIYAALRGGDAAAAEEALRTHIVSAGEHVRNMLETTMTPVEG